jgi:hypothetical protein
MLEHQRAHGVHVVAPDGIDQPAREHEPGPARPFVASREHELRVGEQGDERA